MNMSLSERKSPGTRTDTEGRFRFGVSEYGSVDVIRSEIRDQEKSRESPSVLRSCFLSKSRMCVVNKGLRSCP